MKAVKRILPWEVLGELAITQAMSDDSIIM
jgi:hypothetical protein